MVGSTTHPQAKYGRADDRLMAHVAHGEMIVPAPVIKNNPVLVHYISQAIKEAGADPEQYKVGNAKMSINPATGKPEFGFFGSIFNIFRTILPFIATAVTGNPAIGAAVGAGLGATNGGGIPGALLGGASGYFGGSGLNGAISGVAGLPAGSTLGSMVGAGLSGAESGMSSAASSLGNMLGIGSSTVGTAGKVLGALSLVNGMASPKQQAASPLSTPASYRPKRPGEMAMPLSLSQYSGFDPTQQRSALATQGLNTGLGADENAYYRNMLQRALIGDHNKVDTTNTNFLLPVESSYFAKQGINTGDITKFLAGISN
jgi:hypothetical protein